MTHLFSHAIIKWFDLVALVILVGGFFYQRFILKPIHPFNVKERVDASHQVALLALGIMTLIDLIMRAMMASGLSIFALSPVIPSVLTRTYFGPVLAVRFGLILLAGIPRFLEKFRWLPIIGICLTTALLGHAGRQGILTLLVLVDTVHIAAISCWVGGLLVMRMDLPARLSQTDRQTDLLIDTIERFSTLAITAVSLLMITGIINSLFQLPSPISLTTTAYGNLLLFKWIGLIPMLLLGFISRYVILPGLYAEQSPATGNKNQVAIRLRSLIPGRLSLQKLFFYIITLEAALGIGVLTLTAVLTQLPLPHD
jgi:putative copper export protein